MESLFNFFLSGPYRYLPVFCQAVTIGVAYRQAIKSPVPWMVSLFVCVIGNFGGTITLGILGFGPSGIFRDFYMFLALFAAWWVTHACPADAFMRVYVRVTPLQVIARVLQILNTAAGIVWVGDMLCDHPNIKGAPHTVLFGCIFPACGGGMIIRWFSLIENSKTSRFPPDLEDPAVGPRTGFIASIAYYIAKDPWKLWSDGSISNINCVMVVFSVLAILHWWSTMFPSTSVLKVVGTIVHRVLLIPDTVQPFNKPQKSVPSGLKALKQKNQ